jgi:hypothetical protein
MASIIVIVKLRVLLLIEHVVVQNVLRLRTRLVFEGVSIFKKHCKDPLKGVKVYVIKIIGVLDFFDIFLNFVGLYKY